MTMTEVAHPPLTRAHTHSTGSSFSSKTMSHSSSSTLVQSQSRTAHMPSLTHASTASGATLFSSASSVASSQTGGSSVMASDSIINSVADSSKSLYQICVKLKQRLSEVPGFEEHLDQMEADDKADDSVDPVTSMWRCLRKGYPLMTVYNALNPGTRLEVDPAKVPETKRAKTASFKFVQACLQDLKFPSEECFLIMDLYGEDTTGFVKVTKVVNRVLDILQQRNLLYRPEVVDPAVTEGKKKKTRRDFVIGELVDTERKYVQDLETLQQFKKLVEEQGVVAGDTIHAIFLNLNALLDFQRRFLIRIETMNSQPESQQNWGQLFTQFHDSFRVYEPYIANQQYADEQAMREFEKLQKAGHKITDDRATLSGFIMKPFQRLSKYPLLLKELRDKCDVSERLKADISAGMDAATSILERANSAIDKEQRQLAVNELQTRVEDWKGHNIQQFGELLLYGTFTVVKGDGRNDVEREYRIYLFERILLCCKEQNPNKQKNKMGMNKPALDKKGKPRLQLKGRIFMQNVTDTLKLSKPGSYTIQIFWKGDPGVENFVIRFTNEETMKKWYNQVVLQHKYLADSSKTSSKAATSGTSDTEFAWVREQGVPVQNPYQQEDELDDDQEPLHENGYYGQSEFSMSRNASNSSLRSRSTTGDSGPLNSANGGRMAPPRFPMGSMQPPSLSLHTQIPHSSTPPGDPHGPSYFSPTVESPVSSRASSQSSMYPFPRQNTPNNGWPNEEHHNRFTAPAMGRPMSREAHGPNGYQPRNNMRPSLPAMAPQSMQPSTLVQNRSRSASSPDIQQRLAAQGIRIPNGSNQPDVPMPPIPSHIAHMKNPVNRSQNNSPNGTQNGMIQNGLLSRSATQSPGHGRERTSRENYYGYEQPSRHDPRTHMSSQNTTPVPGAGTDGRARSGHAAKQSSGDPPTPTQLKVKVSFESNYVTLVVGLNISYQSLVDRIDAKLSRFTGLSIGRGDIRVKYEDEDEDLVTMANDEDVQTAFEEWRKHQKNSVLQGQLGEIQLYCSTTNS